MRAVLGARAFHNRRLRGKRDLSNISLTTNCIRIIVTRALEARLRWKDKYDLIEFYVIITVSGRRPGMCASQCKILIDKTACS